jgi:hypothetical protein
LVGIEERIKKSLLAAVVQQIPEEHNKKKTLTVICYFAYIVSGVGAKLCTKYSHNVKKRERFLPILFIHILLFIHLCVTLEMSKCEDLWLHSTSFIYESRERERKTQNNSLLHEMSPLIIGHCLLPLIFYIIYL